MIVIYIFKRILKQENYYENGIFEAGHVELSLHKPVCVCVCVVMAPSATVGTTMDLYGIRYTQNTCYWGTSFFLLDLLPI